MLWLSVPGARPRELNLLLQACPSSYYVHVFAQGNGYDRRPETGRMPWYVDDFCRLYINLNDGHTHATLDVMADASVWGLGPD